MCGGEGEMEVNIHMQYPISERLGLNFYFSVPRRKGT